MTPKNKLATGTDKHGKRPPAKRSKQRAKHVKSIRLSNKQPPLRVKVTTVRENSDMEVERKMYIGYVAENTILYDDSVVLSKEPDGFPYIELPEHVIEMIEFIDPDEEPIIYSIKQ